MTSSQPNSRGRLYKYNYKWLAFDESLNLRPLLNELELVAQPKAPFRQNDSCYA